MEAPTYRYRFIVWCPTAGASQKDDLVRVADMVIAVVVPEALRRLGEGRALGRLVIEMG